MFKSIISRRAFSVSAARADFAKMQLHGSIGTLNFRETKDGTPFVSYSLAVNRYAPLEAEGDKKTVTDWYNVSVFDDKQVAFFQNYLRSGAKLYVDAEVRHRTVVDEAGEKLILTTLRQTSFDVVRFPKKLEEKEDAPTAEA